MKKYISTALVLLAISCAKDGDMLVARLDSDNTPAISSFDDHIVITKENASRLMLTLYWNDAGSFTLNNPEISVPEDIMHNAIQFSSDPGFSVVHETVLASGSISAQFTGSQLNVILSRLDLEPGVEHSVSIRLKTSLGPNTEPRYGEAAVIHVTGFHIDMSKVRLLATDKISVIDSIPAMENGRYEGYVYNQSEWLNFWFEEGDGTVWGTYNDGTTGTAFLLTSEGTGWNNWFPAPKGFYHVTLNTASTEWTAMSIASVNASIGGETISMTYAPDRKTWGCVFTTEDAGMEIGLVQEGWLYDRTGGDAAYTVTTFSFAAGQDGTFEKMTGSRSSGITTGKAGTYTLKLHFSDMSWELLEGDHGTGGGEQPEPEPDPGKVYDEFLYAFYAWDNLNNGKYWEDSLASTLWSADKKGVYTGYFSMGSWTKPYQNFIFSNSRTANDASAVNYGGNTADKYQIVTPASSGYTFWPAGVGVTKLNVDMRTMKWSETTLGTPVLSGNAEGTFTFDSSTVTWSCECSIANAGDGIKIIIGSETFGGAGGKLVLDGPVINMSEAGTHTVTVSLHDADNLTYTITKN